MHLLRFRSCSKFRLPRGNLSFLMETNFKMRPFSCVLLFPVEPPFVSLRIFPILHLGSCPFPISASCFFGSECSVRHSALPCELEGPTTSPLVKVPLRTCKFALVQPIAYDKISILLTNYLEVDTASTEDSAMSGYILPLVQSGTVSTCQSQCSHVQHPIR